MTGYIFAAVWFALAAYLAYQGFKAERFFLLLAVFFAFLGGWAVADIISPADLMAGVYGWIYRGVAAVMLIVCAFRYYLSHKRGQ